MQSVMKSSVVSKASVKPIVAPASIGVAMRMVAAAAESRVYIAPKKRFGPPEGNRSSSPDPVRPTPVKSYTPAPASTPSSSSTPSRSSGVYIAPKKPLGPPEGSRSNSPTPQPTSPIIKKPVFRATSPEPARSYSAPASSTPSYSSTPSRSSSGVFIAPKKPIGPPEGSRSNSPTPQPTSPVIKKPVFRATSPEPARSYESSSSTSSYSAPSRSSSGVYIAPKKPIGPPEGSRSNSPTPQPTSPVIKKPVFRATSPEPARTYESSSSTSSYSAPPSSNGNGVFIAKKKPVGPPEQKRDPSPAPSWSAPASTPSASSSKPSPSKVYIAPKKKFGPS